MKKITLLLSALVMVLLAFYSCEQGQIESADPDASSFFETKPLNKISRPEKIHYCGEQEYCLIAGQHIDAGNVKIGNDDNNLYITVSSKEGFQNVKENVKINVVTDKPTSRPPAGHFPYKATVPFGEKTATFQIPLTDLGINPKDKCEPHQFYVLVHADVIADGGGETAWGGCDVIGRPWFAFIDYYTQCCECWCGFGNDFQTPEDEACLSMMYEGTKYIFWSNKFEFEDLADKYYQISLLVNPSMCTPQNTDGEFIDRLANLVGEVVLNTYRKDGKNYVDINYTFDKKYEGYNIQLDLYIGADRKPKYDLENKVIKIDELHQLFQHKLTPGETSYTFKGIPWLTNNKSTSYIAVHAAIGDCPMPSLQNPM